MEAYLLTTSLFNGLEDWSTTPFNSWSFRTLSSLWLTLSVSSIRLLSWRESGESKEINLQHRHSINSISLKLETIGSSKEKKSWKPQIKKKWLVHDRHCKKGTEHSNSKSLRNDVGIVYWDSRVLAWKVQFFIQSGSATQGRLEGI